MNEINHGLILENPTITDYVFGYESGVAPSFYNSSTDWTSYIPANETQWHGNYDAMDCVSESAINQLNFYLNALIKNEILSDTALQFLKDGGYIKNGTVNLSQRFVAKMSGTTRQGNTINKVWETIRKCGVVPEIDYPKDCPTWDAYYAEIPQEIKNKALRFLEIFNIKWEWVATGNDISPIIKQALTVSPVQIALTGHAVCDFKQGFYFDSYDPFVKPLTQTVFWGARGIISEKTNVNVEKPCYVFTKPILFGQRNDDVIMLQRCLHYLGYFSLSATGYFGENTRRALKTFQIDNNIAPLPELQDVNGMRCGLKTISVLNQMFDEPQILQTSETIRSDSFIQKIIDFFKQ